MHWQRQYRYSLRLSSPVYTIQPVVKSVVQPLWQPVVSCKRGIITNRDDAWTRPNVTVARGFYTLCKKNWRGAPNWVFTSPRQRLLSTLVSMSVCASVCLSARICPEPHAWSLPQFLCMLPISVARSSSGMLTIGRIAYRREGSDGSAQRGRSVIDSLSDSWRSSFLVCRAESLRALWNFGDFFFLQTLGRVP